MKRGIYLGCAVVLAAVAALLTLRAQHTVAVVVAAHDVPAGVVVTADDVSVVRMHDDGVAAGFLSTTDSVVGRYVRWPLVSGEPVLSRELSLVRSGSSDIAGLDIQAGYSAIALPVQPDAAVGGMLAPGDRVDVYASPAHLADGTGGASASPATLIGHDVVVIQLRNDQGQALQTSGGTTVHGLNFGSGKIGSVVVAIPTADASQYAAAVNNEVIYLALSVS